MSQAGTSRPAKRSRYFTLMIVPHSAQEPWSFRIPKLLVEVVCATIGVLGICLLLFTNAYQRMSSNMDELVQLRETTREQRAMIDDLHQKAAAVNANLAELEELERQVRDMLGLPQAEEHSDALLELFGIGPETDARPQAMIAQLAPPSSLENDASRHRLGTEDVGPRPPVPEKAAGVGGHVPALDTVNLGGLAHFSVLQVEPNGEAEAGAASANLLQARAHSATLLDRLATLQDEASDQLEYLAAKPSIWPAWGPVTSHFGTRQNPFGWGNEFHAGIDIGAPYGAPIVATGDGIVILAGWDAGYGRKVEISHGYGLVTAYAHASELAVSVGDYVEKGDVIAYVGSSGRSTAPHLHYEVWMHGRLMDPWEFLP